MLLFLPIINSNPNKQTKKNKQNWDTDLKHKNINISWPHPVTPTTD